MDTNKLVWNWHHLEGAQIYFHANFLLRNSINCICTLANLISRLKLPSNSQKRLSRSLARSLAAKSRFCEFTQRAVICYMHSISMWLVQPTLVPNEWPIARNARGHVWVAITMLQTPFGLHFTSWVIILLFLSMLQVSPPPFVFAFIVLAVVTCELQFARPRQLPRVCICDGCLAVRVCVSWAPRRRFYMRRRRWTEWHLVSQ